MVCRICPEVSPLALLLGFGRAAVRSGWERRLEPAGSLPHIGPICSPRSRTRCYRVVTRPFETNYWSGCAYLNMAFGSIAWIPFVPSTTWVTVRSIAALAMK